MKRLMELLAGAVIVASFLLSGCYRVSNYTGDGQLADNGASAATDRYVLNLGPVDLTQRGSKTFRIENLPEANFVVGLEIVASDNNVVGKKMANPTLAIVLTEPGGKTVFRKKAPLVSWTWSERAGEHQAFVYGRDEPRTYFDVTSKTQYTLTLDVLEPDRSKSGYTASLIAKSGGWK